MTGSEERALLADYMATCARLHDGFLRAADRVAVGMPVSVADVEDMDSAREDVVLAYLKRYEQLEDALHRTLKTVSQLMSLGKFERLTPRDVGNRAEKLGIVDDAARWAEAVRTRNALAHEYPLRPDKRAAQINRAWSARETLLQTWTGIRTFVEQEGLLRDEL